MAYLPGLVNGMLGATTTTESVSLLTSFGRLRPNRHQTILELCIGAQMFESPLRFVEAAVVTRSASV
jgi:hypothetical protein